MLNVNEIDTLRRELRTDKVAIRQKACARVSQLCSSQRKALNRIFSDEDSDLSYETLFYSAHEGKLT